MAGSAGPRKGPEPAPRWAPASHGATLLAGVVLLFLGLWTVTGSGSLAIGWAAVAVGWGLTLVGAVAQGVAWGLDLHDDRRRQQREAGID